MFYVKEIEVLKFNDVGIQLILQIKILFDKNDVNDTCRPLLILIGH